MAAQDSHPRYMLIENVAGFQVGLFHSVHYPMLM
jgi:hypothetical protein